MIPDSKKPNILHVVNIFFVIPYFLGKQLPHFTSKGYTEHVICSPSNELEDYAAHNSFRYKAIPVLRKISPLNDLKAMLGVMKYIVNNKIDIVVGHTPKGAIIAMSAAWLCRVPKRIYFRHGLVYETSHGIKRTLLMTIDRVASLLATKVVCVSPSVMKRSIEDKLAPAKKQLILNRGTCNGIDLNRFNCDRIDKHRLQQLRQELGISEDNFVIGYVGRLVNDKGTKELVEAFKTLQKKRSNIKLLLVGMFEERDHLPTEVIDEISHNSGIIHTGYVSYDIIEYYYSLMSVLVLPSYREGFPTSVIEASAMELPVVTTRATGCIDSIEEGVTGFFTDINTDSIANVLTRLVDNNDICTTLGKNGRKLVEQHFDEKIVWDEIEKLYKS